MAEYCNGLPPIALVPGLTECVSESQPQSIGKLPKGYPETLLAENLQDAYQYTSNDFSLDSEDWVLTSYAISGSGAPGESTVVSTCNASQINPNGDGTYYTYYNTVQNLQGERGENINYAWIVYPLNCSDTSRGISKGPAALIIDDLSILPSPTVTPGTPPLRVLVNNPWHNVLRCSRNNIIYATQPDDPCRSGKWRLTFKDPGAFSQIYWECVKDDSEGSDEDESFEPWPSDYSNCDGIDIDLSIYYAEGGEISYDNMNVAQLQKAQRDYSGYPAPFKLHIKVTCDQYYPGGYLTLSALYNNDSDDHTIRPDVIACFPEANRSSTIDIPIRAIDPTAAPGGVATLELETWLDISASPCSGSKNYKQCCTNEGDDVTYNKIDFGGYMAKCAATVNGCTVRVPCETLPEPEPGEFTGELVATYVQFHNSEGDLLPSSITFDRCGRPISYMSTIVYLHVEIDVVGDVGAKYCTCSGETLSVSLSATGVSAQFMEDSTIEISPGIYTVGENLYSGSLPILISGQGKADICSGQVSAGVLGVSDILGINSGCTCPSHESSEAPSPEDDAPILVKGEAPYIVVTPSLVDGRWVFTVALNTDMFTTCDEEEEESEEGWEAGQEEL